MRLVRGRITCIFAGWRPGTHFAGSHCKFTSLKAIQTLLHSPLDKRGPTAAPSPRSNQKSPAPARSRNGAQINDDMMAYLPRDCACVLAVLSRPIRARKLMSGRRVLSTMPVTSAPICRKNISRQITANVIQLAALDCTTAD